MTTLYLDLETVPDDAFVGMPYAIPGCLLVPQWAIDATKPESDAKVKRLRRAMAALPVSDAHHRLPPELVAWYTAAHKLWAKGALDPLQARIVAAGVSVDGAEPLVFSGDGAEIRLWSFLDRHMAHFDLSCSLPTLVAYNCGFDRQVAYARALKAGFPGAAAGLASAPWEDPGEFWRKLGSHWYPAHHHSLGDLCRFMGIPHDDTFTGADVLHAYVAGQIKRIADHCYDDVQALVSLHRGFPRAAPLTLTAGFYQPVPEPQP